jgi:tRNA-specific 2-thiouridylase
MVSSGALTIAVAMSGGVDSSLCAALLQRAGHRVLGFTLRLGGAEHGWEATRACCGLAEVHDARRVADTLGIPHYVLNHAAEFERAVIADFVAEYAAGRTPNPCLRCNQHIKFAAFLAHAQALGCSHVATGHYARVDRAAGGRWRLRRGADPSKDQSYVLHTLTQEQLAATLFPLGALTKGEVRARAAEFGLPTAAKPESQELCFVSGDYAEFVGARRPDALRPGPIVDPAGRVLGTHRGLARYTVGQRKGLGVYAPEPWVVVELRAADNTVVVARPADAGRTTFLVAPLHAGALALSAEAAFDANAAFDASDAFDALVQTRYRMTPVAGRLTLLATDRARCVLAAPTPGIAPGQAAVCYDEAGYVLAGGTIATVEG